MDNQADDEARMHDWKKFVRTNFFIQGVSTTGHGKSADMWRDIMKRYGFNEEIVLHVIDLKASGKFVELLEELYSGADSTRETPRLDELMRLGRKSGVMVERDVKDHVQYPTLEAYTAAHGLDDPVADDEKE